MHEGIITHNSTTVRVKLLHLINSGSLGPDVDAPAIMGREDRNGDAADLHHPLYNFNVGTSYCAELGRKPHVGLTRPRAARTAPSSNGSRHDER